MYTRGLRCDRNTANRKTDAGSFTVAGSCSIAVAYNDADGVTFAGAGTRSRTDTNEIIFKESPAHDSQSEVSYCQGK